MNEEDRSSRQRDELESLRRRVRELEAALGKTPGDDETLALDDQWFRMVLENSFDGINICKYDRRTHKRTLIICNDRYVEMSGRSREELLAADHLDLLIKFHTFPGFGEPGSDKRTHRAVSSWNRPDGKENYYEWTAAYVTIGDDVYMIGVDRDITEHRRMDKALGESEYLYRTTIDAMSDAIHVVDADLRLTLLNRAFAQWCGGLGLEREALGKNLFEAFPFLPDKVRGEYRRVFETGEPLTTEEVTSMGGRQFTLDVRKVPILEAGKVVRVITVIYDITERKRAEDALLRSEAKYRTLTENLPQRIFAKDRDSVYVSCNESYARALKINPEELVGKTDYDFFPRELAEKYRADDKRIMRSGQAEDIEERFVEDGRERIVHTVKTPIKDDKGDIVGVLGIFWDVTEQKCAEEALRESEEMARALLNGTPDAAFLMTPDGFLVVVNNVMAEMIGKPANECAGLHFREVMPNDLLKGRLAQSDKVVRSGKPVRFEDEYKGRFLDHSVYPVFDAEGKVSMVAIFARDITEQKRAGEVLRESERRLRMVIQNMPIMMDAFDSEGNIVVWNTECERVTGYSADEIVGNPKAMELLYPDADYLRRMQREWEERGNDYRGWEWEITRKDGAKRMVAWFNVSERFPIPGWPAWGFGVDVTERKRAEEAIRAAQHKLVTAREDESRRLARELHDTAGQRAVAVHYTLQNILARARERLDEDIIEQLENVSGNCNEVVRELRHISHGLYPPTLESLGLAATLRQLARDTQGGIEVTVSCPDALESARFGEEVEIALFRIAQEALNNALRHSKASSVELRLEHKADRLHLTVTDNGSGFRPSKADGKGLGLTSMRERAQAIGGELDISSRKGSTRVRVTVPAESVVAETPADGVSTPGRKSSRKTRKKTRRKPKP